MKIIIIIIIEICISAYSQAQTIEKFSIDSGGSSVTTGGVEILYTIGEVNVQELVSGSILISEGFINSSDSNTLGINEVEVNDENIVVYPNPASDFINIKTNVLLEKVELYDLLGKQVIKTNITYKIYIRELPKGVYILKMYYKNKKYNKKIVIQ